MSEYWFNLTSTDQAEALEVAAATLGRPAHLIEKDIWVVWALSAIYQSPLSGKLTFKGGTSLSKVFKVIDRFSEDIDLTYDIRELVPDLLKDSDPIPASSSQEKKITSAVRARLPAWIETEVLPVIKSALERDGLEAGISIEGKDRDKLILDYQPLRTGTGYSASKIQLEFGGRATGEPHQKFEVGCDIASVIHQVTFPTATPLVMSAERTFWEKATAAHVYCLQGKMRGERYSRHWFDLAALSHKGIDQLAATDKELAQSVAEHKAMFFPEKSIDSNKIDYVAAVSGGLRLIPEGAAFTALQEDYLAMCEDGLLTGQPPTFAEIMECCRQIRMTINKRYLTSSD